MGGRGGGNLSWWTFRIFFIFFCSGEGKGESEALGGEGAIFYGKFQEGVSPLWVGAGGKGPGGCLLGIWGGGGGANIFFSEPKCPPSYEKARKCLQG